LLSEESSHTFSLVLKKRNKYNVKKSFSSIDQIESNFALCADLQNWTDCQ
jgi:hypothetical protein